MGIAASAPVPVPEFESTIENDFDPFNVTTICIKSQENLTAVLFDMGLPPKHTYTRQEFSALSLEKMAAYADGVTRGSFQQQWFVESYSGFVDPTFPLEKHTYTMLGSFAYIYLKTGDQKFRDAIQAWRDAYQNDTSLLRCLKCLKCLKHHVSDR